MTNRERLKELSEISNERLRIFSKIEEDFNESGFLKYSAFDYMDAHSKHGDAVNNHGRFISEVLKGGLSLDDEFIDKRQPLKNFTYDEVANYIISILMEKDVSQFHSYYDNEIYVVSYIRASDNYVFTYQLKFDTDTAVWGNFDGRWRDTEVDEKISFFETGNELTIHITYSDNSVKTEKFKKQ